MGILLSLYILFDYRDLLMTSAAKRVFIVLLLGAVGLTTLILVARKFFANRFSSLKTPVYGQPCNIEATIAFKKSSDTASYSGDIDILKTRLLYIGNVCSINAITSDTYSVKIKNATDIPLIRELLTSKGDFACRELYILGDIIKSLEMADKASAGNSQTTILAEKATNENPDSAAINALLKRSESAPDSLAHPLLSLISLSVLNGSQATNLPAYIGRVREKDTARLNALLNRTDIKKYFPQDGMFTYGREKNFVSGIAYLFLYVVRVPVNRGIDGSFITSVDNKLDPDNGAMQVTIKFGKFGTALWEKMTRENIHKPIAITLDNIVFSAPVVEEAITNGNTTISMYDVDEARALSTLLQLGPLSARPVLRSFKVIK